MSLAAKTAERFLHAAPVGDPALRRAHRAASAHNCASSGAGARADLRRARLARPRRGGAPTRTRATCGVRECGWDGVRGEDRHEDAGAGLAGRDPGAQRARGVRGELGDDGGGGVLVAAQVHADADAFALRREDLRDRGDVVSPEVGSPQGPAPWSRRCATSCGRGSAARRRGRHGSRRGGRRRGRSARGGGGSRPSPRLRGRRPRSGSTPGGG